MKPPAKNDPCWCGSGIKFEYCHWPVTASSQGPNRPEWQGHGPALDLLVRLQRETEPYYDPDPERREVLKKNNEVIEYLLGLRVPEWDPEDPETLREQLSAEGVASATVPSSPLEGPITQYLLNLCVPPIIGSLRAAGYEVPKGVAVGTLRTGEVNAMALAVPGVKDAFVIAYNTGTILYLQSAGVLFSTFFPKAVLNMRPGPELVNKVFEHAQTLHDDVTDRLSSLLAAILDNLAPRPLSVERERLGIATAFSRSMLSFVLAHEYAHVVLGHLEHASVVPRMLGTVSGDTLEPGWEDEFAADVLGARATLVALSELGPIHSWAHSVGVPLTLYALELLERAADTRYGISSDGGRSSHPPTSERLYSVYSDVLIKRQLAFAAGFSEIVGAVVEFAWPSVAEQLAKG